MASTLSRRKPGPNVWRQWRAKRVHCTPGLGRSWDMATCGDRLRWRRKAEDPEPARESLWHAVAGPRTSQSTSMVMCA